MIAPLSGVVVALGSLLAQAVGLADGGVQVDGQGLIARSSPSGPRSGQQFSAHPIQLAHVAPPEAAQEGAQRGRRLHRTPQHPFGAPSAQRVGIINAITTSQGRRHQRQQLISPIGPIRRISQVNVVVHQIPQSQMMGQSNRQDQAGVGHQAMIIEGDLDAVRLVAW